MVKTIVKQLKEIYALYRKQRYFRCYDSSVLLTYDAENIIEAYKKHNPQDTFDCRSIIDTTIQVRIRMIDFGKTVTTTETESNQEDENYLRGLRSLISLFEDFLVHPPDVTANVETTRDA